MSDVDDHKITSRDSEGNFVRPPPWAGGMAGWWLIPAWRRSAAWALPS